MVRASRRTRKLREVFRTFFHQLKHLSFIRLKLHINAVHEVTGKNRVAIFLDMVWCEVRYGIGYLDYHVFGFAERHGAVRKTYMTAVHNQALTRQMNDPAYFYQLNDKIEFDTIFADLLKRRFLDLRKTDAAGLRDFCAGTEAIFCKPAGLCAAAKAFSVLSRRISEITMPCMTAWSKTVNYLLKSRFASTLI